MMDRSVFVAVFRNGFSEVLMVLNVEKAMVEKRGEKNLSRVFFNKDEGWGCPGGGVETRETIFDAALREVREEAGIEVSIAQDTVFVKTPAQDNHQQDNHQKVYFAVTDFIGEPKVNSDEVKDVAWVPVKVILSDEQNVYVEGRRIYNGHRRSIRELLKKLGEI